MSILTSSSVRILPAFLYFLGIFLGVHFKAKKLGSRRPQA